MKSAILRNDVMRQSTLPMCAIAVIIVLDRASASPFNGGWTTWRG